MSKNFAVTRGNINKSHMQENTTNHAINTWTLTPLEFSSGYPPLSLPKYLQIAAGGTDSSSRDGGTPDKEQKDE